MPRRSSAGLQPAKPSMRAGGRSYSLQLQLLEDREMSDALAGLAFLRALPDVVRATWAVVGHSFGGSLSLLMAEREPKLRAVVCILSCAGYSWDQSPQLRERLLTAMAHIGMPVFFIHAANDHSLAPGKELDADFSNSVNRIC